MKIIIDGKETKFKKSLVVESVKQLTDQHKVLADEKYVVFMDALETTCQKATLLSDE